MSNLGIVQTLSLMNVVHLAYEVSTPFPYDVPSMCVCVGVCAQLRDIVHYWARVNAFVVLICLCNMHMTGILRDEGPPLIIHSIVYMVMAVSSLGLKRVGTWQVCEPPAFPGHALPRHAMLCDAVGLQPAMCHESCTIPRHATIVHEPRAMYMYTCHESCTIPRHAILYTTHLAAL